MELKPGYKQTEVGVIPKEWSVKALGDIGEPLIGLTYKPSDVKPDGVLVLRSSNVADGTLQFENNVYVDMEVPSRIIALKGDILICVRNGSRELIGKCAKIDDRAEGMTFGAFMAVLRTPFHDFVYYQFQSEVIQRQIHEHLGATINQITNRSLKSFLIPFPEDDTERRAIAAALSDLDTLLAKLDELITKKRDLKQAAMQQFLTGQTRLPGFKGEWKVKRLGEIGSFRKGKGIRKDEVVSDGLPCVRYGEIYTHHRDYIREFFSFIPTEVAEKSQRLRKGDLLFAGSGETAEEIGKCVAFLHDREAYAGGDIVIFSPVGQNSLYLGYLMNHASIAEQKARMGQGDAVVHISTRNLAELNLCLPHEAEQTAIAAVLSDMDAEIVALEQRLAKTRHLKQGMMQELLTGRIRLPVSATSKATSQQTGPVQSKNTRHNWAFNEAVVIAALANKFGSREYPLGRLRYTKLAYLMHRHVEGNPKGYLKKAAGPYNPATRYKGPEGIAQKNGYVQAVRSGTLSGFVSGENIDQALFYFRKWYGSEVLEWLGQFRYEKNEALELLATVDMAILDLRAGGRETRVENVKEVLRADPEWKPKLRREVFSDANIKQAIAKCRDLFG